MLGSDVGDDMGVRWWSGINWGGGMNWSELGGREGVELNELKGGVDELVVEINELAVAMNELGLGMDALEWR